MGCRIDPWQASICLRLSRGEPVHWVWSASPYGDLGDGAPWSLSGDHWDRDSALSTCHTVTITQKGGPEIMNEMKVQQQKAGIGGYKK